MRWTQIALFSMITVSLLGCQTSIQSEKQKPSNTQMLQSDLPMILARLDNSTDQRVVDQTAWIKELITNDLPMRAVLKPQEIFTHKFAEFLPKYLSAHWGYSEGGVEENWQNLKVEWGNVFDLRHTRFSHPFDEGNCGWEFLRLDKVKYLGQEKAAGWYQLDMSGGCNSTNKNDPISRIVKVIGLQGRWFIDAVYSTLEP